MARGRGASDKKEGAQIWVLRSTIDSKIMELGVKWDECGAEDQEFRFGHEGEVPTCHPRGVVTPK